MNCPHCQQVVEAGAAFCGNCGQALAAPVDAPGIPAYALTTPAQHRGETKAVLALVCGIVGIVGAVFIALLGLAFGAAGLVLGTLSRSGARRGLSTSGIVASSLALVVGLGVWAYAFSHTAALHKQASAAQASSPAVAAADLSTPCYSVGFVDTLNVSHSQDSCNMNAYNGDSLETSSNAYKIYANQARIASDQAFAPVAKQAVDNDVRDNLAGYTVDTAQAALFAGSPAYFVHVSDKVHGVAIVEAAVFHKTASGQNVFILVHATAGKTADLNTLETQWQWK